MAVAASTPTIPTVHKWRGLRPRWPNRDDIADVIAFIATLPPAAPGRPEFSIVGHANTGVTAIVPANSKRTVID
jgi:hypothetical protein